MDDTPIDRAKLLPRSGIGVVPPWLVIAPPGNPVIRVDLRVLDRVELVGPASIDDDKESDRDAATANQLDLVLVCGDLEVALAIADGPEAARQIAEQATSLTRESTATAPPADLEHMLIVGTDVVFQRGEYIVIGTLGFRIHEVREYALRGQNVPLTGGRLLQAALALLVVAAAERP
jgi:hypothetical protein